ncbi:MAG: plasmid pRiA4b ORF-3 family protein [Phycisphaerales bacterium]|nr:plasmid pRiA4b ORF-3 family protein [Phycisphaerales bacterium]
MFMFRKSSKSASQSSSHTRSDTWYQLKITLRGSKPPIWRRIVVPDCSLDHLHYAIQLAMGWHNSHLHDFEIGGRRFAGREPLGGLVDSGFDDELDAAEYILSDVVTQAKMKILYQYDFGDSWYHVVLVEKMLSSSPESPDDKKSQPFTCLAGKGACPPEDCGGIWGYYNMLDILKDPKHPEHDDMKEWAGDIDPDTFDLAETNERLSQIQRR